jgi:uncharacterized protein (UPF0261 family)
MSQRCIISVVDVAGMNSILRIVANAAGAIVGMVKASAKVDKEDGKVDDGRRKRIAIIIFGVTTPFVDIIRRTLTSAPYNEEKYEIYISHAARSGGRAGYGVVGSEGPCGRSDCLNNDRGSG